MFRNEFRSQVGYFYFMYLRDNALTVSKIKHDNIRSIKRARVYRKLGEKFMTERMLLAFIEEMKK